MEILLAGESGRLDGTDGLGHLTRPNLQPGQAKCPCKMDNVVKEPALWRQFARPIHRIARPGPSCGPLPESLSWRQLSPLPPPAAA